MKFFPPLVLSPVDYEHAEDILHHYTKEINVYMTPQVPPDLSYVKDRIKTMISRFSTNEDYVFVIRHEQTDDFLGMCGLHNLKTDRPHIGLWLKKDAQDQGFGKITVQTLLEYAKELNIKDIYYDADYRNTASIKLANKFRAKLLTAKKMALTPDRRILYINSYLIKLK